MKLLNIFLASCLTVNFGYLQAQSLLPIKQANKWGLADLSGKEVVKPEMDYISQYNEVGYAIFKKNGKKGVLKSDGSILLPAKYTKIRTLNSQLFGVYDSGKWGAINTNGKQVIASEFTDIYPLPNDNIGLVNQDKFGMADKVGKVVIPVTYDDLMTYPAPLQIVHVITQNKHGLFDYEGKEVVETVYSNMQVGSTSALAKKGTEIIEILYQSNGKLISTQVYPNATVFKAKKEILKKSLPKVSDIRWVMKGRYWVLLDEKGDVAIDRRFYDIAVDKKNGLTIARQDLKDENDKEAIANYVIDHKNNKILFKHKSKDIFVTDYEVAEVARISIDTLWDGLVNKKGVLIREVGGVAIENIGHFNAQGNAFVKGKNGLYGAIDKEGNLKVPFQYDFMSNFIDGYAIVKKDGYFGSVNNQGKLVIPTVYDGTSAYSEGVFRVKKGKKSAGLWGCVDGNNKTIVPFSYKLITPFVNGVATVLKDGKWGAVNNKGKVVTPIVIKAQMLEAFKGGIAKIKNGRRVDTSKGYPRTVYDYVGYVDQSGKIIIPAEYTAIDNFDKIYTAHKGITKIYKGAKVGYVNYKGAIVMPPKYDDIKGFEKIWGLNDGIVKIHQDGKTGYLDHTGQELVAPDYSYIKGFETIYNAKKGFVKVKKNGYYGYLNHLGQEVIPCDYTKISTVKNGKVVAQNKEGKRGVLDLNNKRVLDFEYDGLVFFKEKNTQLLSNSIATNKFVYKDQDGNIIYSGTAEAMGMLSEGAVSVKENGLWGFKDKEEKWIVKPQYEAVQDFHDGLAGVKKAGKWGYINKEGKQVIASKYLQIRDFSSGVAWVSSARLKNTFITKDGKELIALANYAPTDFIGTIAVVRKGKKAGILNNKGKWLLKMEYTISDLTDKGYCVAELSKKYALIGPSGKAITKFKYGYMGAITSDGLITVKEGSKYGFINLEGKTIIAPSYSRAGDFSEGLAGVQKGGKWGYVNPQGKLVIAPKFRKTGVFGDGFAIVNDQKNRAVIINKQGNTVASVKADGTVENKCTEGRFVMSTLKGKYHMDTDGVPVYEQRYDEVLPFRNGVSFVKKGEKWELTRRVGSSQVKLKYTLPSKNKYIAGGSGKYKGKMRKSYKNKYGETYEDLKWTKISNGKWKRIDEDGHQLDKIVFEAVETSKEGITKLEIRELFGIIDVTGKEIVPPIYEDITLTKQGLYRLTKDDKIGYVDQKGQWIYPIK